MLQERDSKIEDLEAVVEKLKAEFAQDEEKMTAQVSSL